jgi:diguanylate cyclase
VVGGAGLSAALEPRPAFDTACRMVVDYLARAAPMGAWAVTRVAGPTQVVLVAADSAYGFVSPGAEFPWDTAMCRTMAAGSTPRVVPDTRAVPALAAAVDAAAAQAMVIGAYVGTPIVWPDGRLFGTVCGVDPGALPGDGADPGLLDLLSNLLSTVLQADTASTEAARALEQALGESETDPLTGLLNRRGWDRWIDREEDRFRRFGDPASVVVLDLDLLKQVNDTRGHDAGDRYIRNAADVLRGCVRDGDALARFGGDEFAMVVRTGRDEARELVDRMETALSAAGVQGSFGFAPYSVVTGFPGAVADADAAMYETKRRRRASRG